MNPNHSQKPLFIFLLNLVLCTASYYISILLHEWGHGTIAWLYGLKTSPFDIYYGGWSLLHVDEAVHYTMLMSSGKNVAAALIGVAGSTVSFILVILSWRLLKSTAIQKKLMAYVFFYWVLIASMVPLIQYFTLTTFSTEGDIGRFTHGLNISPWLIFIPGTMFVIFMLRQILKYIIPKAYSVMSINSLWGKRLLLLLSLSGLFLFIYTHGYNPLTDQGTNFSSKLLSIFSILLVPILFFIYNPKHGSKNQ